MDRIQNLHPAFANHWDIHGVTLRVTETIYELLLNETIHFVLGLAMEDMAWTQQSLYSTVVNYMRYRGDFQWEDVEFMKDWMTCQSWDALVRRQSRAMERMRYQFEDVTNDTMYWRLVDVMGSDVMGVVSDSQVNNNFSEKRGMRVDFQNTVDTEVGGASFMS